MIKSKNCCRISNNILFTLWVLSLLFYFPVCLLIDKYISHGLQKIAYIFYAIINFILLIYYFCNFVSYFKQNANIIKNVLYILFLLINISILFIFVLSMVYAS